MILIGRNSTSGCNPNHMFVFISMIISIEMARSQGLVQQAVDIDGVCEDAVKFLVA